MLRLNGARTQRACGSALLLLGVLLVGCTPKGPQVGTVEGTVKVDGKTATAGEVNITAADGQTITGMIQNDGKYRALNVPVGDAKAAVKGPSGPATSAPAISGTEPTGGKGITVPAKYGNAATSGLTKKITTGTNQWDFDLSGK